jgi:hypothetical protein
LRHAFSAAGLPLECQPHGLRKATGRRLAEASATAKMIMSILGHTTLAEAERYTEEADQAGLAEDAVLKLEGHKANRFANGLAEGLGKSRCIRFQCVSGLPPKPLSLIALRAVAAPPAVRHGNAPTAFTSPTARRRAKPRPERRSPRF